MTTFAISSPYLLYEYEIQFDSLPYVEEVNRFVW